MDKFLLTVDMLSLWATVVTFVLCIAGKVRTSVPLICLFIFIGLTIFVMAREFKNAVTYDDPMDKLDTTNKETPPWEEDA